jgi:isopenicillin N synthase-like dioxygenase
MPYPSQVDIPVVDFSKFQHASSNVEKQNTADTIVSAFRNSGFIYIDNHGVPPSLVNTVFTKVLICPPFMVS